MGMALYPNHEADHSRDAVLSQHISRVAATVTPSHRDLKISRRDQYECPWPAAQAELRRLAAFKMPEDKVQCVTRVSKIIMNLLSLAQDKSFTVKNVHIQTDTNTIRQRDFMIEA